MSKKSGTQEILEAQVIHKGGRVDLKELWKDIEAVELDPNRVRQIHEEQKATNQNHSNSN
jgi:hypothetical protein